MAIFNGYVKLPEGKTMGSKPIVPFFFGVTQRSSSYFDLKTRAQVPGKLNHSENVASHLCAPEILCSDIQFIKTHGQCFKMKDRPQFISICIWKHMETFLYAHPPF